MNSIFLTCVLVVIASFEYFVTFLLKKKIIVSFEYFCEFFIEKKKYLVLNILP